jgi:hypothetical protein
MIHIPNEHGEKKKSKHGKLLKNKEVVELKI